jgi:ABC-type transport system involved in multi-copper enzyme maturation permease subunit
MIIETLFSSTIFLILFWTWVVFALLVYGITLAINWDGDLFWNPTDPIYIKVLGSIPISFLGQGLVLAFIGVWFFSDIKTNLIGIGALLLIFILAGSCVDFLSDCVDNADICT